VKAQYEGATQDATEIMPYLVSDLTHADLYHYTSNLPFSLALIPVYRAVLPLDSSLHLSDNTCY
jgi:hypothetical protein